MSSAAAIAFDQKPVRTADDLEKFWKKEPVEAATWAANVARAAGLGGPALEGIQKALKAKDEVELKGLLKKHPEILKLVGDQPVAPPPAAPAQPPPNAAAMVGWIVDLAKAAPVEYVGRLKLVDNVVKFETNRGTYDIDLSKTSWREEVETAFMGRLMTFKANLSADGTKLIVLDLRPGIEPALSGRIGMEGDDVIVSPGWNANIKVKVTDPVFKKLLKAQVEDALKQKDPNLANLVDYSPAGVILPGDYETDAQGNSVYPHSPDNGFYILGRTMELSKEPPKDGYVLHRFHTGYFRETDALMPVGVEIPERSQPGKGHWDPNDKTLGSTKPEEGRRTFFYAKIIPPDVKTPFELKRQRRLEIMAVMDASDQGAHAAAAAGDPTRDVAALAKHIPASRPDADELGFAPPKIKKWKFA